jgi:3-oxoacyl-(acyl-carrier-protein) synthase
MGAKAVYYLNGIGIISPQKTFDPGVFLTDLARYDTNVLQCIQPDFKAYINPIQMRRLSRMLRIGLSAAVICLRDSRVNMPDGIITATGYGFLDETKKFLLEVLNQNERQLTPTYFMQSTSNALAGLVALTIKCMGYNNTYASKGYAFENAMTDAMMQINENKAANFLVGCYDEAAGVQYEASRRLKHYKEEKINNLSLFDTKTKGSIQGEGVAFFMISGVRTTESWCAVHDIQTHHRPASEALHNALKDFLHANSMDASDVDVVISGASGDFEHDAVIDELIEKVIPQSFKTRFKHLCGEYTTSTGFALWLGASILKRKGIPEIVKVDPHKQPGRLNTVLVINQYLGKSFSFALLTVH